MACSVCVVLFLDSRVGNVCRVAVAYSRDLFLRRADVAFFRGNVQLTAAPWVSADRVEVRFRGSKGDQMRTGRVLTRVRGGGAEAFGCRWRRRRSHDRVDVFLSVFSVLCPPGCVRYGQRKMVYVDAAGSNDIVACSGCVGGRACGRVRFALPQDSVSYTHLTLPTILRV